MLVKQKFSIALALIFFINIPTQAREQDPDAPAIDRPVHISDRGQYVDPYIPVYRTTRDGRLSYNVKSNQSTLRLYLNAPEKITQNYHDSPNGPAILATTTSFNVNTTRLRATNFGGGNVHTGICEVPDAQGNQKNPYACGDDDCYDVVFIQSASADNTNQQRFLQGTPGTIRVNNPKTPNARIVEVDLGNTVVSPHRLNFQQIFEPQITEDGHLLVGRVDNSRPITWRNLRTNRNVSGRYDMVYSVGSTDPRRACDVTQWNDLKPLGHAPYDPEMNTRYGFAMQPFRDAQGNVIPDNNDLVGSYPWVDATGDLISFATFGIRPNFPVSCVPDRPCNNNNYGNGAALMGKVIAGLWTKGKMVLVDNLVNHIDFPQPQQEDNGHRLIDIYRAGTGPNASSSGLVRIGHGRDNNGNAGLAASATNSTFQESTENKLNFWRNMRPSTPSDVVWHHSSGAGSDELAFDDYLYENSFIISSMVQSSTNNGSQQRQFSGVNGRVQNAAASERWNVPAFGSVVNGARVENVALGGVHGKGVFLRGNQRIDYTIPNQPRNVRNNNWQISLFVDSRFANDNRSRNLINFPDGSELQLVGRDQARYWKDGSVLRTVNFPSAIPQDGWAHIGIQMSNRNRTATFYLNGFAVDRFQSNQNFFEMRSGLLSVGDHATRSVNGARMWVDDFKVIGHNTNVEGWCAQANGQLVGSNGSNNRWANIARTYPNFAHEAISEELRSNDEQEYSFYACYVDYSGDYLAREDTIPSGFRSIRESINFPEGPLVHNEPRPESRNNGFCLQCHTATAPAGLSLDALAFNSSLTAANDPRRQPMQPPARVFGNIPANWLGSGLPATALVAPEEGLSIDEALLPDANPEPLWQEASLTGQVITHASNGRSLTVGGRINNSMLDIALTANPNSNESRWELIESGSVDDNGNPYYFIQNSGTRMRIQDLEGDTRLVPTSFSGALVQWSSLRAGSGTFIFVNRSTGRRLHAPNNGNGAPDSVPNTVRDNSVRWRFN